MSVRGLRRGSISAARVQAAVFSPLSISWPFAFWASDPAWTPPSDGGAVASWPDASGNGRTASQATSAKRPIYRASSANFNSKPCVEFDGTDDLLATAVGSSLAQPNEVFFVAKVLSNVPANSYVIDGAETTARHAIYLSSSSSTTFTAYAGSGFPTKNIGESVTTRTHLHDVIYNGDASTYAVDGGSASALTGVGTNALTGLTLASRFSGSEPGHVQFAFIGVHDGLSAGQRSDLIAWSRSFYGTP